MYQVLKLFCESTVWKKYKDIWKNGIAGVEMVPHVGDNRTEYHCSYHILWTVKSD